MVPVGMLKMLTRLSVPTLTHHWPGKRQRGAQSQRKLAAEDWTPGDLGTGAPHNSLSEALQITSLRGVPADEGHGQAGWSGRVRKG